MYKSDGEEQEINYHYQLESGIRLITKEPFNPTPGNPPSFKYNGDCIVVLQSGFHMNSRKFSLNEKVVNSWEEVVK